MILDVEFREFLEISPDILTSLPLVCFQKRSRSRTLGLRYYLYLDIYLHFLCCREGPDRGPEVGVARAAGGHAAQLPRHGAGAGISIQLSTNISTIIYNIYRQP